MTTAELMNIALEMAGLQEIPHDSSIMVEGENIKKILMGVDMESAEIMLAKQLGYDCVVGHHPTSGSGVINFHKVMERQIDIMVKYGVPINKAQKAIRKRMATIDLGHHVANYDKDASVARLIEMPYLNIHIPADIITENYLQNFLDKKFEGSDRKTVGDVIDALKEMPEYGNKLGGPVIRVGGEKDYAGKTIVLMAGGTNGGADVMKAYFEAGVGTVICMHVPEDVKRAVEEQNIGNIIVAGHMLSDSIGINLLADAFEKKGMTVTRMGGIIE